MASKGAVRHAAYASSSRSTEPSLLPKSSQYSERMGPAAPLLSRAKLRPSAVNAALSEGSRSGSNRFSGVIPLSARSQAASQPAPLALRVQLPRRLAQCCSPSWMSATSSARASSGLDSAAVAARRPSSRSLP